MIPKAWGWEKAVIKCWEPKESLQVQNVTLLQPMSKKPSV